MNTVEINEVTIYSLVGMGSNPTTIQKILFWVMSFGVAVMVMLSAFGFISLLPDGGAANGWV